MEDKNYLLWLSRVKGIGIKKKLKMLEILKSGQNIFQAKEKELRDLDFLTSKNIESILIAQNEGFQMYLRELVKYNIKFTSIMCDDYPISLGKIIDPPIVLYYKGQLPNNDNLISIIGARHCTQYGKTVAYDYGKKLSKHMTVVSGMALGVDTHGHRGALDNGGKTIAVLGCGVNVCYPKTNEQLMRNIIQNGCVVSEYPPNTKPLPAYFPIRNRIISGLSKGVLVVEAKMKSGTLITVDYGLEQNKDIFAVPGSIWSKESEGTNNLLKDGAYMTTTPDDILSFYKFEDKKEITEDDFEKEIMKNLTDNEKVVYRFITKIPVSLEELSISTKLEISDITVALTMLELKGVIRKLAGQFQRI